MPTKKTTPPLKKNLLILGLGVLLYILLFISIDKPLAEWIAALRPDWLVSTATVISFLYDPKIWYAIAVVILILGLLGSNVKQLNTKRWQQLGSLACSVVIMAIVCTVLKHLLGRARPILYINAHVYGLFPLPTQNAFFSSPSGHMVTAMALLFCCFALTQSTFWRSLLLVLTIAVGCARMILLRHYLGDLVLSIALMMSIFPYGKTLYGWAYGWAKQIFERFSSDI